MNEVSDVLEQCKLLRGNADMTDAAVERNAKLLIEEYLNDGIEKVHFQ
jgi:hypothetical protein